MRSVRPVRSVNPLRAVMAVVAISCGSFGVVMLTAPAAGADGTTTPSPSTSAGNASNLGGFEITASAAGLRTTYEQPNFPVPATPTLELNIGWSNSSYNFGPTGESTASTLYPGQVAAGFGSQLNTLLDPYLEPYLGSNTPNLNAGPWPLLAATAFPQGPQSASQDSAGVNQDASSNASSGSASSSFGTGSGSAALPSGVITVQSLGSSVLSTVDDQGDAVSEATSAVHGVTIAGGLVTIGSVTSTATSTSDGTQAQVNGSSAASQVSVVGEPVTVSSSGVTAGNSNANPLAPLLPSVSQVLSTAGITMSLTTPTDTVDGPSAERTVEGLQITIDLSQLDKGLSTLASMLPPQLQQQILDQLPLALPDKQVVQINLGWLDVASAASPAYNTDFSSGVTSASGANATDMTGPALSPSGGLSTGPSGTFGSAPSAASTPGSPSTGGSPGANQLAAATPAALFRGIGAGLIVLGALIGAALAGLLLIADRAVDVASAGSVCPDDPSS